MTQPINFDARWLTSTVCDLLLADRGNRSIWHNSDSMSILADALMDAGCDDEQFLADLRLPAHDSEAHWRRMPIINSLIQKIKAERIEAEKELAAEAHAAAIADKVAELESRSRAAYAERNVSRGYWLAQYAAMLKANPGFIRVEQHDLRGTPPAGTIWIRASSGGKYGRSRKNKFGRPLTAAEMRQAVMS